jgi:hypothetical protein
MGLLQSYRRIFNTDYAKQYQDLINTLSVSVNQGFDNLYQAMQNNVNLTNNILCTVASVPVTVDSTGNPIPATAFAVTFTTKMLGATVIAASGPNGTYPTSAPLISYTQNNKNVTINNISGLQANTQYTLTIVAWGT